MMARRSLSFGAGLLFAVLKGGAAQLLCSRTVASTADAESVNSWLADCVVLSVSWEGRAELSEPIVVGNGKTLRIAGIATAATTPAADGVAAAAPTATVDGSGVTQLFYVERGGALSLTDVTLTGGFFDAPSTSSWTSYQYASTNTEFSGGCIFAAGGLELQGCHLSGCRAELGGAVFLGDGADAVVKATEFVNNTAMHGGGIYAYNGAKVTVTLSRFAQNSADQGGGFCNFLATSRIDNTSFEENSAAMTGGGFHMYDGTATVKNSRFSSNSGDNGGGLWISSGKGTVVSCDFTQNSAIFGGGVFVGWGFAGSRIESCGFLENHASSVGGGIYTEANLTIIDGVFASNAAAESGGALAAPGRTVFDGSVPAVTADRCTFTANQAVTDGGAIWARSVAVTGSTFSKNSCGGAGGAVHTLSQLADDGTNAYSGNKAASAGGAIFMEGIDFTWDGAMTGVTSSSSAAAAATLFAIAGLSKFSENTANCCYRLPPANGAYSCVDVSGHAQGEEACCGSGTVVTETTDPETGESGTECAVCPEGFDCSEVGPWPSVEPGFWRAATSGFLARRCLVTDACDGGSGVPGANPDSVCAEGYEGPYCAVCSDGFSRTLGGYGCKKCSDGSKAGVVIAIILVGVLVAAAITYVVSELADVGDVEHGVAAGGEARNGIAADATRGVAWSAMAAGVFAVLHRIPWAKLRIPLVVWQIISQYVALSGVVLPPLYAKFVNVLAVLSFDLGSLLSVGCVLDLNFYDRLLIGTLTPFVLAALLACSNASMRRWARRRAGQQAAEGQLFFVVGVGGPADKQTMTAGAANAAAVQKEAGDEAKTRQEETKREEGKEDAGEDRLLPGAIGSSGGGSAGMSEGGGASGNCGGSAFYGGAFGCGGAGRPDDGGGGSERDGGGNGRERGGDLAELIERVQSKHAMIFLVLTFVVYSWSSTLVFQTFACDSLPEVDQKWLRADYSLSCEGATYRAYRAYATVMVLVYPIGIPVLYVWCLWRQHERLMAADNAQQRDVDHSLRTTRFLWNLYKPSRHWWEVAECVRRLCLTGFLVFIFPQTSAQSAVACVFAMVSLAAITAFAPHADWTDTIAYAVGCMIIFFTTFLALIIKVNIADEESQSQAVLSGLLIFLNVAVLLAAVVQCALVASQARRFVEQEASQIYGIKSVSISWSRRSGGEDGGDGGTSNGGDSNGGSGGGGGGLKSWWPSSRSTVVTSVRTEAEATAAAATAGQQAA